MVSDRRVVSGEGAIFVVEHLRMPLVLIGDRAVHPSATDRGRPKRGDARDVWGRRARVGIAIPGLGCAALVVTPVIMIRRRSRHHAKA